MRPQTVTACVLIGLSLLACIYGVISLIDPPYTDQEIRASLVDTWEPEAIVTSWLLCLLILCLVLSLGLWLRSVTAKARALTSAAVTLSILGGSLIFASHAALTVRVTRLTGQTFSALYGLL